MIKFNKVFNSKIISLILACVFLITNIAYGIDLPERSHLRKHLDFNDLNATPRYLCALLAATYHSSILKDKSPERALAKVMEEMGKRNAEELGIKVEAHEGGIRIYHEQDDIDIVANDDGTFGLKKSNGETLAQVEQSQPTELTSNQVSARVVTWSEIVAMINQGNRGSRYMIEKFKRQYGHLEFVTMELSVKNILEKEGEKEGDQLIVRLDLNNSTVKAIAESEEPILPILVIEKNGRYIVLDGSHRTAAAARKAGAYRIDAMGRPKIDLALLSDEIKIKAYFAVYEEQGIGGKSNQGLGTPEAPQPIQAVEHGKEVATIKPQAPELGAAAAVTQRELAGNSKIKDIDFRNTVKTEVVYLLEKLGLTNADVAASSKVKQIKSKEIKDIEGLKEYLISKFQPYNFKNRLISNLPGVIANLLILSGIGFFVILAGKDEASNSIGVIRAIIVAFSGFWILISRGQLAQLLSVADQGWPSSFIFIKPGLTGYQFKPTVDHELAHLLNELGFQPNSFLASAIQILRTVELAKGEISLEKFKEASVTQKEKDYRKAYENFKTGMGLMENAGLDPGQRDIEARNLAHKRAYKFGWISRLLNVFKYSPKEPEWHYYYGYMLGGMAYKLGQQIGSPDAAWQYLALVGRGVSPVAAEMEARRIKVIKNDLVQLLNNKGKNIINIEEETELNNQLTKLAGRIYEAQLATGVLNIVKFPTDIMEGIDIPELISIDPRILGMMGMGGLTAESEARIETVVGFSGPVAVPASDAAPIAVPGGNISEELDTVREQKIIGIVNSILKHGLLGPQKASEFGVELNRGLDGNPDKNIRDRSVSVTASEIPDLKEFLKRLPKASEGDYILEAFPDMVRELVCGYSTKSPVTILGERDFSSLTEEAEKYGKDIVEERLRSGVLILMSTPESYEKLIEGKTAEGLSWVWSGIVEFPELNPNLIEAIFVPTGIFDAIKNSVPKEFRNKVIEVEEEIHPKDKDLYRDEELVKLNLAIPDWYTAIYKYLSHIELNKTFMLHGVRLPTLREITNSQQLAPPAPGLATALNSPHGIESLPEGSVKTLLRIINEHKIEGIIIYGGKVRDILLGKTDLEDGDIDLLIQIPSLTPLEKLQVEWQTLYYSFYPEGGSVFEKNASKWTEEELMQGKDGVKGITELRNIADNLSQYPQEYRYFLHNIHLYHDVLNDFKEFSAEDFKGTPEQIKTYLDYSRRKEEINKTHFVKLDKLKSKLEIALGLEKGSISERKSKFGKLTVDYLGSIDEAGKIYAISGLRQFLDKIQLSINTLGFDSKGQLIDQHNGLRDLRDGILRFVGEDPIKYANHMTVLTAIRFKHQLGFKFTPDTEDIVYNFFGQPDRFPESGQWQRLLAEIERDEARAGEDVKIDLNEGKISHAEDGTFNIASYLRDIYKNARHPREVRADLERMGIMPIINAVGINLDLVEAEAAIIEDIGSLHAAKELRNEHDKIDIEIEALRKQGVNCDKLKVRLEETYGLLKQKTVASIIYKASTLEELRNNVKQYVDDGAEVLVLPWMTWEASKISKEKFLNEIFSLSSSDLSLDSWVKLSMLKVIQRADGTKQYVVFISEANNDEEPQNPDGTTKVYHQTTYEKATDIIKWGYFNLPGRWCFMSDYDPAKTREISTFHGDTILAFNLPNRDLIRDSNGYEGRYQLALSLNNKSDVRLPDELRRQFETNEVNPDFNIPLIGDKTGFLVHQSSSTIDIDETLRINRENPNYEKLKTYLDTLRPQFQASDNLGSTRPINISALRLQELKERIFDEIDRSIHTDAVSLDGRIGKYKDFVLSQAKKYGIRVENRTPNMFEYNKEMVISLTKELQSLFSELIKGNLRRAARTLPTVIAHMVYVVFQVIPPMVLASYKADGELDNIKWSAKGRILYSTNLAVLVGAWLLGADYGFIFLVGNVFMWIVINFARVEGHELSHVYQRVVLERTRQELVGNKMSPEAFAKLISSTALYRTIDTYPAPLRREPPSRERLKAIVEGIFEELSQYASLTTQEQGFDLGTSAVSVQTVLDQQPVMPAHERIDHTRAFEDMLTKITAQTREELKKYWQAEGYLYTEDGTEREPTANDYIGACGLARDRSAMLIRKSDSREKADIILHTAGREGLAASGHVFLVVKSIYGKNYLVDTTFIQFFDELFKNMFDTDGNHIEYMPVILERVSEQHPEWKAYAEQLLKDGFIELNDDVANMYLSLIRGVYPLDKIFDAKSLLKEPTSKPDYTDEELEKYLESLQRQPTQSVINKRVQLENIEGALKQIGDEDAVEVSYETIGIWREAAGAKSVETREIKGLKIEAKFITDEDNKMPREMSAYHLYDSEDNLIIVTRSGLSQNIIDEAIYHETKEAVWIKELIARAGPNAEEQKEEILHKAHILASAEESLAFSQEGRLTSYHQSQIDNMVSSRRQALIDEDRTYQHGIIAQFLGEEILTKVQEYEILLKKQVDHEPASVRGLSETKEQVPAENEKVAKIILNAIEKDTDNIRDPNKLCGWIANFTFGDTSVDPYKVLEIIIEEFDQTQYLDVYREVLGIKISKVKRIKRPVSSELIEQRDWNIIDTANLEELLNSLKPSNKTQKINLEKVEMSPLGHGIVSSHSPEELADLKEAMAMVNKWVEEEKTMGEEGISTPFTIHGTEIPLDGKAVSMNINDNNFTIKAFKDRVVVETRDASNVYSLFERVAIGGGLSGIAVLEGKEFMFYIEGAKVILRSLHEILQIHRIIAHNLTARGIRGIRKATIGLYRADGGFRDLLLYPYPEDIPRLMNRYFEWLQKEEDRIQENNPEALHPVELAAQAFCKLLWIHPFENGNTRTASLIMNYILIKNGFPPFMLNAANEKRFYELERFMDAPVGEGVFKNEKKIEIDSIIDGDKIFSFTSNEYTAFLASQIASQMAPDMLETPQPASTLTSSAPGAATEVTREAFLESFSRIISGEGASEARINWVRENIESIRKAVQGGRHQTGYYPASGYDGLRVLVAYDLDRLVTCDKDRELIGQTEQMLKDLGIEPKANDIEFNDNGELTRREITFKLFGRERTITEFYINLKNLAKDEDLLKSVKGFEDGQVDVFHVYLPAGAGEEAENRLERLNEKNYGLLREGGFFCFEEKPFGIGFGGDFESLIPTSIYGIFGLKKVDIISRHPATVYSFNGSVSEQYDRQELRHGGILHKAETINGRLVELIAETAYQAFMVAGDISGALQNENVPGDREFDEYGQIVISAEDLKADREYVIDVAEKLSVASAAPELIEHFKGEIIERIDVALEKLEKNIQIAGAASGGKEREGKTTTLNDLEDAAKMRAIAERLLSSIEESYNAHHRENQKGNARSSDAAYMLHQFIVKELGIKDIKYEDFFISPIVGEGLESAPVTIMGVKIGSVVMNPHTRLNPNGAARDVTEETNINLTTLEEIFISLLRQIKSGQTQGVAQLKATEAKTIPRLAEGALKQIGDEDAVEVPYETKEAWREESGTESVEIRIIKGLEIHAKFIIDKDNRMPSGMSAYHLYDSKGDLIIVTRSGLSQNIIDEAIYHEAKEEAWIIELGFVAKEQKEDILHKAHILASVEESLAFSQGGRLTPYHQNQLDNMSPDQLRAIIDENRDYQHGVIKEYLGEKILFRTKGYEFQIRSAARDKKAKNHVLPKPMPIVETAMQTPSAAAPSLPAPKPAGVNILPPEFEQVLSSLRRAPFLNLLKLSRFIAGESFASKGEALFLIEFYHRVVSRSDSLEKIKKALEALTSLIENGVAPKEINNILRISWSIDVFMEEAAKKVKELKVEMAQGALLPEEFSYETLRLETGKRLDKGQEGFTSEVWLYETTTGKKVVIKVANGIRNYRWIREEGEILSKLHKDPRSKHFVVSYYGSGETSDGRPFIALEPLLAEEGWYDVKHVRGLSLKYIDMLEILRKMLIVNRLLMNHGKINEDTKGSSFFVNGEDFRGIDFGLISDISEESLKKYLKGLGDIVHSKGFMGLEKELLNQTSLEEVENLIGQELEKAENSPSRIDAQRPFQIGKLAAAREIIKSDAGVTAEVKDSQGNSQLLSLTPQGTIDIPALRLQLEDMTENNAAHKELVSTILSLLENSPPELRPQLYIFDTLIEDLFGFASTESNLIALHQAFTDNPIALFHEIAEYLIRSDALNIDLTDHNLILTLNGKEIGNVQLSDETFKFIQEEHWEDKWQENNHYLLRALQREIFGQEDRKLTENIKDKQGTISDFNFIAASSGKREYFVYRGNQLIGRYPRGIVSKEELAQLDGVTIKGVRLSRRGGSLALGGKIWVILHKYPGAEVEVEIEQGKVVEVRILDENGANIDKVIMTRVYDKDRKLISTFLNLTAKELQQLDEVTIKRFQLNGWGGVYIGRKNWINLPQYAGYEAEADISKGIITKVRVLGEDNNVLIETPLALIYDRDGHLIDSFGYQITNQRFKKYPQATIKHLRLDQGGHLNLGGRQSWLKAQEYEGSKIEVDIERGIVTSVQILNEQDQVIKTLDMSLIYDESGILIDAFRIRLSLQRLSELKHATIKNIQLTGQGVLTLGGRRWAAFGNHPNGIVDVKIQEGFVTRVWIRDDFGKSVEEASLACIYNREKKLIDTFQNITDRKFSQLHDVTIKGLTLTAEGILNVGGQYRLALSDYLNREVEVDVEHGHVVRARILDRERKVEKEVSLAQIYGPDGKLEGTFYHRFSPEQFERLEDGTVIKNFTLDANGVLSIGGRSWVEFSNYPNAEVEIFISGRTIAKVSLLKDQDGRQIPFGRVGEGLGRRSGDLTLWEKRFKEFLLKALTDARVPIEYQNLITDSLLRMRKGSLDRLVKYDILTKEDVDTLIELNEDKFQAKRFANEVTANLNLYRQHKLDTRHIEILLACLVPWDEVENMVNRYRVSRNEAVDAIFRYTDPEAWLTKTNIERERCGKLTPYNVIYADPARIKFNRVKDIIANLEVHQNILEKMSSNSARDVQLAQIKKASSKLRQTQGSQYPTTGYPALDIALGLNYPAGATQDTDINTALHLSRIQREVIRRDLSQEKAVLMALNQRSPFLVIKGPPGTGKTTVIDEIAYQLALQGKRVLIASQMNRAIDNALEGLLGQTEIPVMRVGNDPDVISEDVKAIWSQSGDYARSFEKRLETTGRTRKGFIIGGTNIGVMTDRVMREYGYIFDVVVVDEASRDNLAGTLVPLTMAPKAILVGDERQLPPFGLNGGEGIRLGISAEGIEIFNQSLFETVVDRGYDQVMLSTNYRSHPVVSGLFSELFYNGEVAKRGWEEIEEDNLMIIDTSKDPERGYQEDKHNNSYYNEDEAERVAGELKRLLDQRIDNRPRYRAEDFTIITPYSAQVNSIRGVIQREVRRGNISQSTAESLQQNITTIDAYQGRENKVVILSFVRTNPAPHQIGFLHDMRRLNVAISRAQEKLIIIGDFKTLTDSKSTQEDQRASEIFSQMLEYYDREVVKYLALKETELTQKIKEMQEPGSSPQAKDSQEDIRAVDLTMPAWEGHHVILFKLLLRIIDLDAQEPGLKSRDILRGKILNVGLETTFFNHLRNFNIVTYLRSQKRDAVGLDPQIAHDPDQGFYKGVVQDMPFSDEEFDTVVSIGLFNEEFFVKIDKQKGNFKNAEKFYSQAAKEIKRVLKPGGRFLVTLGIGPSNTEFLSAFKNAGFRMTVLQEAMGAYILTKPAKKEVEAIEADNVEKGANNRISDIMHNLPQRNILSPSI